MNNHDNNGDKHSIFRSRTLEDSG